MGWQRTFGLSSAKTRNKKGPARGASKAPAKAKPAEGGPDEAVTNAPWRSPLGRVGGPSDRYDVKQLIGAGSYSHVVEAQDSLTGQLVAIKRIDRVFDDLIDCKRILREIAILRRLEHENVVQLRDICLPQDLSSFEELNLVLEICHSDLKQLFRTPVTLSLVVVRTLLYNTMLGLHYIHSAGVYHRDLKPANCLVNEDCSVKICDFGLARAVPKSGVRRQLTGHVVTRWYRAPELILLQPHYTEAVDIWSLGCIAAELFAMLKDNHQNPAHRKPLFRGSSCFPLSPEHEVSPAASRSENRDQLHVILSVLGTPSSDDLEVLEGDEVRSYLRFFPERPAVSFNDILPGLGDEGLALIARLLAFTPQQRVSVAEALAHPFLQSVRREDRERVYEGPEAEMGIQLPFEGDSELDEAALRRYAVRELRRFHPEAVPPEETRRQGSSEDEA